MYACTMCMHALHSCARPHRSMPESKPAAHLEGVGQVAIQHRPDQRGADAADGQKPLALVIAQVAWLLDAAVADEAAGRGSAGGVVQVLAFSAERGGNGAVAGVGVAGITGPAAGCWGRSRGSQRALPGATVLVLRAAAKAGQAWGAWLAKRPTCLFRLDHGFADERTCH